MAGAGEFSEKLGRVTSTMSGRGEVGGAASTGGFTPPGQQQRNKANVQCPCVGCEHVFSQMNKANLYYHLVKLEPTATIAHYEYFSPKLSKTELPGSMTPKWFDNEDKTRKLTLGEWLVENKPKPPAKKK